MSPAIKAFSVCFVSANVEVKHQYSYLKIKNTAIKLNAPHSQTQALLSLTVSLSSGCGLSVFRQGLM